MSITINGTETNSEGNNSPTRSRRYGMSNILSGLDNGQIRTLHTSWRTYHPQNLFLLNSADSGLGDIEEDMFESFAHFDTETEQHNSQRRNAVCYNNPDEIRNHILSSVSG